MPQLTVGYDKGMPVSFAYVSEPYKSFKHEKIVMFQSFRTHMSFRKMGWGTKLIIKAKRYASRHEAVLVLGCAPFGDGCMSHEDTRKYYEKRGFKVIKGQNKNKSWCYMEWLPMKLRNKK